MPHRFGRLPIRDSTESTTFFPSMKRQIMNKKTQKYFFFFLPRFWSFLPWPLIKCCRGDARAHALRFSLKAKTKGEQCRVSMSMWLVRCVIGIRHNKRHKELPGIRWPFSLRIFFFSLVLFCCIHSTLLLIPYTMYRNRYL